MEIMHQHGIIIIVQKVAQQAHNFGGCCLLPIGMTAALSGTTCTVRTTLAPWAKSPSATTPTVCAPPFLSNLALYIGQEMAQQVTHTQ